MKGMSGERTSFLMQCLYDILPVESRLNKLKVANNANCELCIHGIEEDLPHALLGCEYNGFVNDWIVAVLIDIDPCLAEDNLIAENIARLNIEIDDELMFPVVWFLSHVFEMTWNERKLRKPVSVTRIKACIGAEVNILEKTKYNRHAHVIERALNFHFS